MDIHRCRFLPYPQSAINALAFSHSHISKNQKTAPPRLAIGRANGDIEIWNPLKGSWLQEIVIHGGEDRSIDELVWIQDPNDEDSTGRTIIGKSRLFSVGYTTTVTEWDLERGQPLRHTSGNHGQIWCLAAQPAHLPSHEVDGTSDVQLEGQSLITGCTDGALVLYSTKDGNLEFQKVVCRASSKKSKVISVVFQDRNIVIAGFTDSTIRIYDIRTGSSLRSMSLGSGIKGGPKEIYVCALRVLKNGDIISGDSTGELKIWSGKTYTQMQRIKSHDEDVFTLATSFDGTLIFSGGKDRRTVAYKQAGKGNRWAEVGHRKYHSHDVTTMATLECNGMSVVVSGGDNSFLNSLETNLTFPGVDATPIVLPLKGFGMENQRALPFLPQEPTIRSAPNKRLLLSFWDREINIWRLNKFSKPVTETEESENEPPPQSRKLIAKIKIKGEANITSADLSTDGSMLAVSTAVDIKFFQLRARKSDDGLKISKVTSRNTSFATGARLVQFSSDGKWLCIIRSDSQIVLSRIQQTPTQIVFRPHHSKVTRINRKTEKHIILGGLGTYDRTVTQVAFSSDSRILAVSDLAGYIDTFVLSGQEDLSQAPTTTNDDAASSTDSSDSDSESDSESPKPKLVFGQYWTRNPAASSIPKLPSALTILSFRPATAPTTSGVTTHPIATRHNPNPLAHDLPTGEDRLWVVTATSDIFEFEVLKGALSPWSRRNPTTRFPETFRKVRDQAKGCLWDVSEGRERVWLYGVGWLWMFDLANDFPDEQTRPDESSKKRKRVYGKEEASGAGSLIPDSKLGIGMSRKVQRIEEGSEDVSLALRQRDEDSDEDEYEVGPLQRNDNKPHESGMQEKRERNYWQTFKYRPILGICLVGKGDIKVSPPDIYPIHPH
jgi:U3 small nucleolar RNA-associated protein 4